MKIFIYGPSVKVFLNGRLFYFFHSYKNDFRTTLQIDRLICYFLPQPPKV
jgi:hypothetical protein